MKLSEFSKLSEDYIPEMPVKLGLFLVVNTRFSCGLNSEGFLPKMKRILDRDLYENNLSALFSSTLADLITESRPQIQIFT